MPRRREIPRREPPPDPLYSSSLVTKFISTVMRGGKRSTAERIMYRQLRHHQGTHRRRPGEGVQEGDRQRQAEPRGQVAPRRRLELPGADRGEPEPPAVAQHPLARRLCPRARRRQDDAGAARERTARRRRTCAAARSRSAKTRTGWRKRTRRSRTIGGRTGCRRQAPDYRRRLASGRTGCRLQPEPAALN